MHLTCRQNHGLSSFNYTQWQRAQHSIRLLCGRTRYQACLQQSQQHSDKAVLHLAGRLGAHKPVLQSRSKVRMSECLTPSMAGLEYQSRACMRLTHLINGPGLGNLYVQALAKPPLICRQGSGWARLAKRSVRERWLCWLRPQAGPCRPAYRQSAWGLPAVWQHLTRVCQAGRLYGRCRQRADKDMHREGERACSASASARKVAAPPHAGAALPTITVTWQQAVVMGVPGAWLGCSRPQRGAPCGITRRCSKGLLAEC